MKLVCLIISLPLRAFQNSFIKSESFAANIQPFKPASASASRGHDPEPIWVGEFRGLIFHWHIS